MDSEIIVTPKGNVVRINFKDGVKVDTSGNIPADYHISFIDDESGLIVYQTNLDLDRWSMPNFRYYVRWRVIVEEDGTKVFDLVLNLKSKRVLIVFDSKALGDTVSWFPYVEEFRKKHECEVFVATYWNNLFKETHPEIRFVEIGENELKYYASYHLGTFDNNYDRNKNNWRIIPLQQVASDILGLEFKEIRSKVKKSDKQRPIKEEYVCISEFSTLFGKHWLYPNGWQTLVNHLNLLGYKVVSVSKEPSNLKDVIKRNNQSIEDTIWYLQHAKFFVGVAGGLSWLSWAVGIPVVIISGFSDPISEMNEDCYRVINKNTCHGCYNDKNFPYDRGNWRWCPRNKNFECSLTITPGMVKREIDKIISQKDLKLDYPKTRFLELVYDEIFVRRWYETSKVRVEPGDIVVDLGANVGMFSVFAMREGAKKVYSVEPFEENVSYLRKNLSLWPDCEILPAMMNKEDGQGLLNFYEGDYCPIEARLDHNRLKPPIKIPVESVSFDSLVKKFGIDHIDFLKIDIEGSEYAMFESMDEDYLRNKVKKISSEIHTVSGRSINELIEKLERCGFNVLVDQMEMGLCRLSAWKEAVAQKPKEIEKILYLAPHCSTGGMPQYLLESVRLMKRAGFNVLVVEYNNISTEYVVQKEKIKELCSFYTLNGNKAADLKEIVEHFSPDIIHVQEFPEIYMSKDVADWLYRKEAPYQIIETSHGDVLKPESKKYLPNRFAFVSSFHAQKFENLGIPIDIVEYQIEPKQRPNREETLKHLGLDPSKKHVLNVGLFTPDKNQGEIFEIAREFPWMMFHFVGNQAENFQFYWEPLMKDKPLNCVVWGERGDVDLFYGSMDLFLFTSIKEVNPIVLKEALAWGMKVIMRNLPAYCGAYDHDSNVVFVRDKEDICKSIRFMFPSMGYALEGLYKKTVMEKT